MKTKSHLELFIRNDGSVQFTSDLLVLPSFSILTIHDFATDAVHTWISLSRSDEREKTAANEKNSSDIYLAGFMSDSLFRSIYRYQNVIYYIVEGEAISKRFRTVYNKEKPESHDGEVVKGTKIIIYQLSRVSFQ